MPPGRPLTPTVRCERPVDSDDSAAALPDLVYPKRPRAHTRRPAARPEHRHRTERSGVRRARSRTTYEAHVFLRSHTLFRVPPARCCQPVEPAACRGCIAALPTVASAHRPPGAGYSIGKLLRERESFRPHSRLFVDCQGPGAATPGACEPSKHTRS